MLFPVWNMTPEQAAEEVQPLLGPQGKVVTLPQARQIQVTETGGRLRTIRSIVNAVEQPELGTAGMREFALKYLTFEAAMPTIRQMLGIPAEAFSTPDGIGANHQERERARRFCSAARPNKRPGWRRSCG